VLLEPSSKLPDETSLDEVALPTRIRNVFKYNGLKTVGDVREASDATLRSFQDFGRGSLVYIREAFGRSQG
jgi:DNA-directed RNA polymerase alpha subunit